MQGILYEESSVWLFLMVTLIMGGAAAWRTGRAVASVWKPRWQLVCYVLLLGVAVRFTHFALFEGTLLSLKFYLADTLVLMLIAFAGWRVARAQQMATQYEWLFEAPSPGVWRRKA